jgi:hypothetical protein
MDENLELRKMLWLRHGCDINALYGDDGEMQCSRHLPWLDFKRDSPEEIELKLQIHKQPLTPEPPSEPGWYWLKVDKVKWHMILLQDEGEHGLWIYPVGTGGDEYPLHELTNAQWQGPIKEPEQKE